MKKFSIENDVITNIKDNITETLGSFTISDRVDKRFISKLNKEKTKSLKTIIRLNQ